jgi:hypothetical protein
VLGWHALRALAIVLGWHALRALAIVLAGNWHRGAAGAGASPSPLDAGHKKAPQVSLRGWWSYSPTGAT